MPSESTRKKNYPCLRCNEHVKKTDKAVQCALCDQWVHKLCEGMSDETFSVLDAQNEETGQCFWQCKACQCYAKKFNKRMLNIEQRMQELETNKIPAIETDVVTVKSDIKDLKTTTEKLSKQSKEQEGAIQSNVTVAVLEEMKERESRSCNIIIHNLEEPSADITEDGERVSEDVNNVQQLLDKIEADVSVNGSSRFIKRLGARDEEGKPDLEAAGIFEVLVARGEDKIA